MGGACRLVTPDKKEVVYAPQSTNNFQIKPFEYRGYTFYSCEQAYQSFKFNEGSDGFKTVMSIKPENDSVQGASDHGNEVWWHGQRFVGNVNKDWNKIKVRVMLDVNRAKYAQYSDLRDELLSTGSLIIVGAPSTTWIYKGIEHTWTWWNGRIQMLIREELRPESERNMKLLNDLLGEVEAYENNL